MFGNVLVGADPEVFVMKDGVYVSGHTFPCGSKERPRVVANGAVQCDGMALEFNVRPARSRIEFVGNVVRVFKDLNKIVAKTDKGASLVAIPTAPFGRELIDSVPDDVKALGCNPDFNAYTKTTNPSPNVDAPFRTGAGHVHVGFTEGMETDDYDHFMDGALIARQLDYYLGLPSLQWDGDSQRRELYGKAGAFRPKSYGMEYRVLSNAWVADKGLMAFVYDRTMAAIRDLNEGIDMDAIHNGAAQSIIDKGLVNWKDEYPELSYLSM